MHLILYDGVCALCNWWVRLVLRYDAVGLFVFAPLESTLARELLTTFGKEPNDLRTVYVIKNYGTPSQTLLERGNAARYILSTFPGAWRAAYLASKCMPLPLLNLLYDWVAATRYRLFGKYDACPVPPVEYRKRFLI